VQSRRREKIRGNWLRRMQVPQLTHRCSFPQFIRHQRRRC